MKALVVPDRPRTAGIPYCTAWRTALGHEQESRRRRRTSGDTSVTIGRRELSPPEHGPPDPRNPIDAKAPALQRGPRGVRRPLPDDPVVVEPPTVGRAGCRRRAGAGAQVGEDAPPGASGPGRRTSGVGCDLRPPHLLAALPSARCAPPPHAARVWVVRRPRAAAFLPALSALRWPARWSWAKTSFALGGDREHCRRGSCGRSLRRGRGRRGSARVGGDRVRVAG